LEGIRVLDLSRYAPGPFCTMILGDLGADVLKVEGAASDLVVPEFPSPDSPFDPLNRNKRSLVVNLKTDDGKGIFYQLAEKADVVVEGFRPGVVKRLAIDYETIRKMNPRIVYCSITGYGQEGPYRNMVGHDLNYIAQGGVLGIMSNPTAIPGNIIGDLAAGGMQAAIGILAALVARHSTGTGQFVDISITDGVVSLISLYLSKYLETGRVPKEEDRATIGSTAYYNVYETKDGKYMSVASGEPQFFANLCSLLGREEFIPDHLNGKKAAEIRASFASIFITRTRDEWFDLLSQSDTAVGKVQTLDELPSDPQIVHRRMIVELDHPALGKVRQVGIPMKLSDTPGSVRRFSPKPGEHTREVLAELGYSEAEAESLRAAGVVVMA
jgi:crotonobetainyl-CoA:carnitine CoA-transferase CaiB-like acyl-CoA transferase